MVNMKLKFIPVKIKKTKMVELKKTIRRSMMEIDDTVLIAEEKKQLDRLAGNVLQGDSVLTEEEILNWKEKELIEKVVNTEIKQVDTSEESFKRPSKKNSKNPIRDNVHEQKKKRYV